MLEFILGLPTWFTVVMLLFGAAFTLVFGTMAVLGFRYWLSNETTIIDIHFDDTGEML